MVPSMMMRCLVWRKRRGGKLGKLGKLGMGVKQRNTKLKGVILKE